MLAAAEEAAAEVAVRGVNTLLGVVWKLGTAGFGVFDMRFFWKMCRLIESPSDLLLLLDAELPFFKR